MPHFTGVFVSFLLIIFSAMNGNTYHVAVNGDNADSGSKDSPWRTIQYGVNKLTPGDTLKIGAGDYNEMVNVAVSGSSGGGYIVITAEENRRPVINGNGLLTNSGDVNALLKIVDRSYLKVRGLEITNLKTTNGSYFPVGIWISGNSHHITLENNLIHQIEMVNASAGAHGIAVYGDTETPISGIILDGNEVKDCKLGWSESLVLNGNVTDFIVRNNLVHDNDNIAFDFIGFEETCPDPSQDQARNGIVYDNVAYNIDSRGNPAYDDCGCADGFYVDGGKDIVFERNRVYACNIGFEVASEHGGKVTSGIVVRNNYIHENLGIGLAFGGYDSQRGEARNCIFVNNTFYGNNTDGESWGAEILVQYYCFDNIFENNIVYSNPDIKILDHHSSTGSGNRFDYNLYYAESNPVWRVGANSYTDFETYRNQTGYGKNSLFSNPLFFDSAGNDIHLSANSPAVEKGKYFASDTIGITDYFNKTRVTGNDVDMGAAEYDSTYTSIKTGCNGPVIPERQIIIRNYPNPFNPQTMISYNLPEAGKVKVYLIDSLGRTVKVLVDAHQSSGKKLIRWDGTNSGGKKVAGGLYFCRIESGKLTAAKKVILIK